MEQTNQVIVENQNVNSLEEAILMVNKNLNPHIIFQGQSMVLFTSKVQDQLEERRLIDNAASQRKIYISEKRHAARSESLSMAQRTIDPDDQSTRDEEAIIMRANFFFEYLVGELNKP